MEKIIYPLKNMWITQLPKQGTHKHSQALDDQGLNRDSIDTLYAPYTGKVVRTYPSENEIWFESLEPVEFADGTIDYATILFAHKNDISKLKDGTIIKQGEPVYSEGTKANNKSKGVAMHVHFECCVGKTTGSGWAPAKDGTWNLVNGKAPQDCYFITDEINVIKTLGLKFKKIPTTVGTPVERDEYVDQIEVIAEVLRARKKPSLKGEVLGYINQGIYNIISITQADGYIWYQVEENIWIAYNKEWETLLPRTKTEEEKLKEENTQLRIEIEQLYKTNDELCNKITELQQINQRLSDEITKSNNKLKEINRISTL